MTGPVDASTVIGTAIGIATGLGVPGTVAVLRFVPNLAAKASERNGNGGNAYESVRRYIDDRLVTAIQRQTEILDGVRLALQENTMALQTFMKLEEQRERLQALRREV